MINYHALFTITYGLYLVSSGDKNKGNGFIANTVFQITSEPAKFVVSCNKDNYTAELIDKHQHFAASILQEQTNKSIFGTFGFKTGANFNKLEGIKLKYGLSGTPIILDDSIAYIECKVLNKVDMGTHWLFIGELIDAQIIDDSYEPLTYAYYHKIKNGRAPKNAPTFISKDKLNPPVEPKEAIYECTVCGHIYDNNKEKIKFEDLAEDWTCPVCGVKKEDFIKIEN